MYLHHHLLRETFLNSKCSHGTTEAGFKIFDHPSQGLDTKNLTMNVFLRILQTVIPHLIILEIV